MYISRIKLVYHFKVWMVNILSFKKPINVLYDRKLLWLTLGLVCTGLIMVTSASMPIGTRLSNDPFYFAKRNACFLVLIFFLSIGILRIPMIVWQNYSSIMLLATIVMLLIVLIVGDSINGAARWIVFGPMNIQPAELSKLSLFVYLSSYLVRKVEEVRTNFWGFCKPISIIIILSALLLAQPDLGTVVVLFITALTMLFLVGAKLWQCFFIIGLGISIALLLTITAPYRIQRIISFWNPWDDPFGQGYQLTQSLMAFGRGKLWGQGLGNSIQKLEYLPEAHTDFIFAILSEELGYFGAVLALLMVFLISFRAILIGWKALAINQRFSGFLACSIGIWFSVQTLINVGVAAGILPTKGLTLPLISYGGSSLLIMLTAVVLLLRIDFETRLANVQAFLRNHDDRKK